MQMGCLLVLVAAISPRLALVLVWIFTNLVDRAFEGFLLPLLGLVFLPFTTLIYVLAYSPLTGVSGWGWFFVILAVLVDLGSYGGGAYSRRR
jgi:CDP-diglyceride synthetase